MVDFLTEGNKTIRCKNGHLCTVPLQTTGFKCPQCDEIVLVEYHGTIAGEFY